MNLRSAPRYVGEHPLVGVTLVSLVPYLVLLVYLSEFMHSSDTHADLPGPLLFGFLFVLGVVFPISGVYVVLRRLIKQRSDFKLRMLLETYFSLILIFATAYAVLQTSSPTPSIEGMTLAWEAGSSMTIEEHRSRIHWVYFDSIYLSIVTITTVGYGDISPLSPMARVVSSLESLAGVGFLGLALGHYFSVCLHRREDCDEDRNLQEKTL